MGVGDRMTAVRIVIDDSELAAVCAALGRDIVPVSTKRTAAPVEAFAPNTGNADLDAFMRAARERVGAPKPRKIAPLPKFPYGLGGKMTANQRWDLQRFNEAAVRAWKERGHVVVLERMPTRPGQEWTETIALDGRNVRVLPLGVTA